MPPNVLHLDKNILILVELKKQLLLMILNYTVQFVIQLPIVKKLEIMEDVLLVKMVIIYIVIYLVNLVTLTHGSLLLVN